MISGTRPLEVYDETGTFVCSVSQFDSAANSTRLSSGVEVSIGDSDKDGANEIVITLGASAISDTRVLTFDSTTCAPEEPLAPQLFPGSFYGARLSIWQAP